MADFSTELIPLLFGQQLLAEVGVSTFAAAKAATFAAGQPYIVLRGYYSPGDGGGAVYVPASAGAGPGKFQSADGQWWTITGSNVDPIQFGAKAPGGSDDTVFIQAAINYIQGIGGGVVSFSAPAGYNTTATLNVTGNFVTLQGGGNAGLILPLADYGDIIHAYPGSGTNLQGFSVQNLSTYTAGDTTSGASLHLDRCSGFRVDHCSFQNHYGGILIDGSVHGYIDADLRSDASFATFRSKSFLLRVTRGSNGTVPAEIHIAKADWRGNTGNNRLNYGVLIDCVDGIWFDDLHTGFCQVGMALNPIDNVAPVISVNVSNGYLDTCQTNLMQVYRPSSSYSGIFGLHSLLFSQLYNSGTVGIDWFMETSGQTLWSTLGLGNGLQFGTIALQIGLGHNISVLPGFSLSDMSFSLAAQPAILINNASTKIDIGEGVIQKGGSPNTPLAGLQVTSAVDTWTVDRLRVIGCTNTISDTSSTSNKSVAAALTY